MIINKFSARSMQFVRYGLFSSVAMAAIVSAPAFAQETADAEAEGEIIVTGTRPIAESEAAALTVQKNSDSLVSVVAADSVGRLPDQNIAQAANRLPGLAVESDQGQPRYVSIRGAPRNWTTLSFDGINVVSPEGRDARFDSVPSAIASQIIVTKAVTPDMPGETVAGNVNIVTRSAFDYKGFRAAAKLGIGIAELGNRPQYEGSLVLSTRVPAGDGELGFLVSGSYYERNMITDNFESDWERVTQDQRPGSATRIWVHEAENKLYRLTRRNWSLSGRMDWKPDSDTTISLRSIYTIFTDDEARDNYRFDLDDRQNDLVANTAACAITPNLTPTTSGYADICIGNTPLRGTVYGIDIRQRSTLRDYAQSIFTNTIEGKHEFGDGWKFNWLGNFTKSKDDRSVTGEANWDSPSTRTLRPTVSYDLTDPDLSRLQLFTTTQLSGPTRFQAGTAVTAVDTFTKPLSSLLVLDAVDTTTAYTGRLVLSRDMEALGGDASFKLGFQFDQRTKVVDEEQIFLNTAAQFTTIGLSTDYNQFSLDKPFSGNLPTSYSFRPFDLSAMRAAASAARSSFGSLLTPNVGNFYDVREQIYAGYFMGTLRYDWGSFVGGARVEHIKNRGISSATVPGLTGNLIAENDQTLVFPSAHVNVNVDDTKKLRFSFNTGAARADYDQIRPNVVINDSNETISGGNPAIKPERAYGFDTYFEWFLRPQGYVMLGAYYKRVTDVLYTERRTFGSSSLNNGSIDRSDYTFVGIANAGKGRLFGVEAALQFQLEPWTEELNLPAWLGGFGFSGNVTFNNSEVVKPAVRNAANAIIVGQRKVRLPNTSDVVYSVGPYYEKYGLSLKLQYKYRSRWLDAIADDDTDGGDGYWGADDELDFSIRYAVNKKFEIFFDASNLLDNPGRRLSDPSSIFTTKGSPSEEVNFYTNEWEQFGRRYAGGIRITF
jgi:TonB-dependent receptor